MKPHKLYPDSALDYAVASATRQAAAQHSATCLRPLPGASDNPADRLVQEPSLRVALVTETYPPEVNGVANTCQRFVTGLQARGHRVQLIRPRQRAGTRGINTQPAPELLTIPGLPLPGYRNLQFGLPTPWRLLQAWRDNRPDIVHIITEGPLGAAALWAARRLRIPVVAGFHTNFHQYSQHYRIGFLRPLIERYLRAFHNRCARNLVPTAELAEQLSSLGIQANVVLARGIDTQLFNPAHRSEALRCKWGAPDTSQPVVLYVGRIAPEKNLALAIEAFLSLQKTVPDARFVLVGDGPSAPGLQAKYPDFIFTGVQRGLALATSYASADIFLFPSLTETFGNVTLEAMASGLAVVAFDYAAARNHIEQARSGLRIPVSDPAAFVAAACQLATQPDWRRQLGKQARIAVSAYDWNRIYDTLLALYADVIAELRPAAAPHRSMMDSAMTLREDNNAATKS